MSLIEIADPKGVRAAVLQSLEQHEILPTARLELPPQITYPPNSFEFLHRCHDCDDRMMKVAGDLVFMERGKGLEGLVGPNNEDISPGYHPIDDDWEAPAARLMAMFYDPRWLIAGMENLQITAQGESHLSLRGELPAEKLGIRIEPDRPLESLLGHFGEKREGSEWARQEFLNAFRDPNTAYPPHEVSRFIKELEALKEQDIPDWVRKFLLRPYLLEIELDEAGLPRVVRSLQNGSLAPFPPDGITFEYRPRILS